MEGVRLISSHLNEDGEKEEDVVIDLRDPISIDRIIAMKRAIRAGAELQYGEIAARDTICIDISDAS